jgi:hypothetical protein
MDFDRDSWRRELTAHDRLFEKLGPKQPSALAELRRALGDRLG